MIVKFIEKNATGIVPLQLSRYAIGCVMRGTLCIYDGDKRQVVHRGELFFLGIGRHYLESIPEKGQSYEQILIYYTPQELQRVLVHLNINYGVTIDCKHSCPNCQSGSSVIGTSNPHLQNFFQHLNNDLREQAFHHNEAGENLKITEVIYLLMTHDEECLKHRILASMDREQENFELIIHRHIFLPVSIEEFASKTNRSLTAFKKEFRRHFNTPPHKWFIAQRLIQSRLLLLSTSKSISEIGHECAFPNTSHFIKLFKRTYRMTPASYRQKRQMLIEDEPTTAIKKHVGGE